MSRQVYESQRQKQKIRFLHEKRGLGPADIRTELEAEFGKYDAASRATIVRELRKLRLEREQQFARRIEEGTLKGTLTGKEGFTFIPTSGKRREMAKPVPWTVGEKDFSDEDTALISQVITEAAAYDMTSWKDVDSIVTFSGAVIGAV